MKKINQLVRKISLVFVYSFCCLQTTYADDTEIFYAQPDAVASIKPNVMFILDTSGSMNRDVNDEPTNVTANRKITIAKDVLVDVLSEISNVNAGLMKFNHRRGGPVIYPVTDVDLAATPLVESEIIFGFDDAGESNVSTPVSIDAEQITLNGVAEKQSGLRFSELLIPQGAKITKASITFTAKGDTAGAVELIINGQLADSAPEFTTTNANISSRTLTTAAVNWTPTNWLDGVDYQSEDITSIVQEVVDQNEWCGSNDMAFVIQAASGTAFRTAYSSEGKSALGDDSETVSAARISIEYDSNSGDGGCIQGQASSKVSATNQDVEPRSLDGNQLNIGLNDVAVGFSGLNVPRGATITEAYINFVALDNYSNPSSATIYAVNDATPNFGGRMLSDRVLTTSVSWPSIESWTLDDVYQTPSLIPLVQALVNKEGWNANGNMVFALKNTFGSRYARSYDNRPDSAPTLHIKYEAQYSAGLLTVREDLKRIVRNISLTRGTPISDTIAEAGQYFRGDAVTYGSTRNGRSTSRISVEDSYTGGTPNTNTLPGCSAENLGSTACENERINGNPVYTSPITDSCQTSHIVYLTDGKANVHNSETDAIFREWTTSVLSPDGQACFNPTDRGEKAEVCAVNIAGNLYNNDVSPLPNIGERPQTVTTHMIGFGAGADPGLMSAMANAGGGGHHAANSREGLVTALNDIVTDIASVSSTFVTTGVTVNQNNRLTHDDELYFSLFSPESNRIWPGNIKRYRLLDGEIVDVDGNNAVNATTAEFDENAQSFWSDNTDGKDVPEGGAAGELTSNRTIYSNLVSGVLTREENRFNIANITEDHLNVTEFERRRLIHWTLGYDVESRLYNPFDLSFTPPHNKMADPLHSQPTVVSYKSGSNERNQIFVGTNDGFLRAINADDNSGAELWAFIPQELLDNLDTAQKNNVTEHNYYGMDGAISVYLEDDNNNGFIDVGSEKAYLYVGMRRGGNSYYALDISDPIKPVLMFIISSSEEELGPERVVTSGELNYDDLGQTWSRPIIGKMNLPGISTDNSEKLVMIFGGGYDTSYDAIHETVDTLPVSGTVGAKVYIADALDGKLLWTSDNAIDPGESEGSLDSMASVPADITAFDLDGDNYIDHFYASDTKAQIFRFDIDNEAQNVKGGRIAALQSSITSIEGDRRFYYPVDAALINLRDENFISVSIGSGFRAHPLNTDISDRFYMIKDKGVLNGTFDMDVTENDLANITTLIGDSDGDGTSDAAAVINDESDPKNGWFLDLTVSGEKVIERSITFNNAVIFTTYIPEGLGCSAAVGSGRVYGVRVSDGNPYVDNNFDGTIAGANDRYLELDGGGIAPQPQVLLEGTGTGVKSRLCVGTQCGDLEKFLPPVGKGITGYQWLNAKLPE